MQTYKDRGHALVYLDESGFAHDMPRTHGYALKGLRCYGHHDWGARGRTNVIGAMLGTTLLTVTLFDTTIDTAIFKTWVERDLIPKLPPHSVVILDNASFHKSHEMKRDIEQAGHILLYLPTYSPDFNPIEKKWAQAKAIRRRDRCDIADLFKSYNL